MTEKFWSQILCWILLNPSCYPWAHSSFLQTKVEGFGIFQLSFILSFSARILEYNCLFREVWKFLNRIINTICFNWGALLVNFYVKSGILFQIPSLKWPLVFGTDRPPTVHRLLTFFSKSSCQYFILWRIFQHEFWKIF